MQLLAFLALKVREFNLQGMTEAQGFRVLPDFLTGVAERQFRSVAETTSQEQGGITSWPEDVQWLLGRSRPMTPVTM